MEEESGFSFSVLESLSIHPLFHTHTENLAFGSSYILILVCLQTCAIKRIAFPNPVNWVIFGSFVPIDLENFRAFLEDGGGSRN